MELLGSKTERALLAAFSGESMAMGRYDIYADEATKEGYEKIADILRETADNERAHAKAILKLLGGIGNTNQNIRQAAMGEHAKWARLYRESADTAMQEGFGYIADFFIRLAAVEESHEIRFLKYLNMIENREAFSDDKKIKWVCRCCGYIHIGKSAPEECPLCRQPQGFFEREHD